MSTKNKTIDVRPKNTRFHTKIDWLDSYHSFSFGPHQDPNNTHHGLLVVSNDDIVKPSTGFGFHSHSDMEIVTWVLSGELMHKDSMGNEGVITPGQAQRMSAGTGVMHSEMNPNAETPVRLIQMWVFPEKRGITPGYEQLDISDAMKKGGLFPIASGKGHSGAVKIHQKGAVLYGARLEPGQIINLPEGNYVHLYVTDGEIEIDGAGTLTQGDAIRFTKAGSPSIQTQGSSDANLLIWVMDADASF